MRTLLSIALLVLIGGCRKDLEAPVPNTSWDLFNSAGTTPVDASTQHRMEGVYTVTEGADMFGQHAVVKWTWTRHGGDTTCHISIFCEKDNAYLTGEGRYLDSTLLLNLYWRTLVNTGTGICRMTIPYAQGVRQLWSDGAIVPDSIRITGLYGSGSDLPERPFTLSYARALQHLNGFQVLAHRCGGRNEDLFPVSENSVEMIHLASSLGATGVEMDVRLTSDGVPVIYHDETMDLRAIQPCGLFGPLENYSYAQLSGIVRLIHGEKIPTLREALQAVVNDTPLEYVWLDTKNTGGSMQLVRSIQQEYLGEAAAMGRDVHILIGLPEEDQLDAFLALPDHASTPSLCELGIDEVHSANSEVWAPRWTLGTQDAEVAQLHGEGRKVFTWTMDLPDYIQQYMYEASFDGILSDYPSVVSYFDNARP
jgi:glycerophosphoryl diester phosphodiesterase